MNEKKKPGDETPEANCETCEFWVYDEEYEDYVCSMALDEDEMIRYLQSKTPRCLYYRFYDEYKTVQKQN